MKQEIINEIISNIDKLNKQRELIENLEIKPVTIKEWGKLCETPLRYDDLLLDIAKVTFPQGYNFYRGCNYVEFKIDGIRVKIPTYRSETVEIDVSWYKKDLGKLLSVNRYGNMRKYFELLDSGEYTWYDLASSRCNIAQWHFSKFKLFVWWFTKAKWYKVSREKWEEKFAKENKYNQIRIEEYYEERKNISEKLI